MNKQVFAYVQACAVCATQKSSHQAPAGLLRPLPIPSRPWSHISMDFVTGLPVSEGNTVILVIVDRFSKACRFVPLPKLPSALETAKLVFNHVLRQVCLHRCMKPWTEGTPTSSSCSENRGGWNPNWTWKGELLAAEDSRGSLASSH